MATEKQIEEVFEKIANELPGLIATSLVDLDSGMTLGVKSNRPDFDLGAASAYNSELVKMKFKTMRTLKLKSTLEDMLLTLSDQIHLIRMVTPATFLYIAVDKVGTNLAIVRSTVNNHVADLV